MSSTIEDWLKDIYATNENQLLLKSSGATKECHQATLRLKCKTKEEFLQWLQNYQGTVGVTYRVRNTKVSLGKTVVFKGSYRCRNNTYPNSHKSVQKPSKHHTNCASTLHVTIKSSTEGRRVRSSDKYRHKFPTIVEINHEHNHPIDDVQVILFKDLSKEGKDEFHDLLVNHFGPTRALELLREDICLEHEDIIYRIRADDSSKPNIDVMKTDGTSHLPHPADSASDLDNWEETNETFKSALSCLANLVSPETYKKNPTGYAEAVKRFSSAVSGLSGESTVLSALNSFGKMQRQKEEGHPS